MSSEASLKEELARISTGVEQIERDLDIDDVLHELARLIRRSADSPYDNVQARVSFNADVRYEQVEASFDIQQVRNGKGVKRELRDPYDQCGKFLSHLHALMMADDGRDWCGFHVLIDADWKWTFDFDYSNRAIR